MVPLVQRNVRGSCVDVQLVEMWGSCAGVFGWKRVGRVWAFYWWKCVGCVWQSISVRVSKYVCYRHFKTSPSDFI